MEVCVIICDHCGLPIDRAKIDLGQQIEFAPGVDVHPECQDQFKADLKEFVASKPKGKKSATRKNA